MVPSSQPRRLLALCLHHCDENEVMFLLLFVFIAAEISRADGRQCLFCQP